MQHRKEIKSAGLEHKRENTTLNQVVKERLSHQNRRPKRDKGDNHRET